MLLANNARNEWAVVDGGAGSTGLCVAVARAIVAQPRASNHHCIELGGRLWVVLTFAWLAPLVRPRVP